MSYSRHRKFHDKPYSCSLCDKKFGLKTDLGRHRHTHRNDETQRNFRCRFPGCKFRGTSRKDYLWVHLQKKHQDIQQHTSSSKPLREYYEEFAREGQTLQHELNLELLEAASTGSAEKVSDLLSRNADTCTKDSRKRTPLHLAAAANHEAVVKVLCDQGANTNVTDSSMQTPLHLAAAANYGSIVSLLCDHGADTNVTDSSMGETALMKAVVGGGENVVERLIESGADVNWGADRSTGTALYLATYHGNESIVRVLLENGADANIENDHDKYRTALHLAVTKGEGVTRALLEANADVNKKDLRGQTPLSYATGWVALYKHSSEPGEWNEATTQLLLEAGAIVKSYQWYTMPEGFRKQNPKYFRPL